MSKAYSLSFDEVLEMSFQNVILYASVIPDGSKTDKDERIDMDDPANNGILRQMKENSG